MITDVSEKYTFSVFRIEKQTSSLGLLLASCSLGVSSVLKMEAVLSSNTSVGLYRTIRGHVLEDSFFFPDEEKAAF
jgi:hypothetical protein